MTQRYTELPENIRRHIAEDGRMIWLGSGEQRRQIPVSDVEQLTASATGGQARLRDGSNIEISRSEFPEIERALTWGREQQPTT